MAIQSNEQTGSNILVPARIATEAGIKQIRLGTFWYHHRLAIGE